MIFQTLLTGGLLLAAPADFSSPLKARGEKEAASSVQLTSDGHQLLLEVEVVDPTPSSSKDDVHSDHVELWFALENLEAVGPTRFVTAGGGRLYTVNGGDKPADLNRSIRKQPEDGGDDRCSASERTARESIGKPPARRVSAFFGLAHLGLFRDGRPAVLYDRPAYAAAGLAPALAPGDVSYAVQKTKRGYHVTAKLQPGALVFVPRTGVKALRARVDVVDAGAPGAPEVLRSSHPAPRWGEPSTFQAVEFAQPLAVQLVAGVPELSQAAVDDLPPYFMRAGEEWRGVAGASSPPTDVMNRYCQSAAEEVLQHVFLQWKLGPATPFAGPDTLRIPVRATAEDDLSERGVREGLSAGELLVLRGPSPQAAWVEGTTESGFRFGDGAPRAVVRKTGFVMDTPMGGPCGAGTTTRLMLWKLAERGPTSTELLSWGDCESVRHGSQELEELRGADLPSDPEDFTWEQPGQKLRVRFGDDKAVDVSWNARDGAGVTVHTVELEQKP